MKKTVEIELGGRKLTLEVGRLAQRSQVAVFGKYGETVVLVTICSKNSTAEIDFLPLTVDYEERLYAGGRISSSRFIKREGRPKEEAILSARLIDRLIRPLFAPYFCAEIQVIVTVLSYDGENDHQVLSAITTSAALAISGLPWSGPVGTVRVGRIKGELILNPTEAELPLSDLDLVVAAGRDGIEMIEAAAEEVSEVDLVKACEFAQKHCLEIVQAINNFAQKVGSPPKVEFVIPDKKTIETVKNFIKKNYLGKITPKFGSDDQWVKTTLAKLSEKFDQDKISRFSLTRILEDEIAEVVKDRIFKGSRLDGRKPDEVRTVNAEVGLLPRTHGSALFTRGETQVLSIVTLGSPALEQLIEGMTGEETKRFMHHYNFPPFSTGEVKRMGSPGRREIGHGVLAEKALLAVIPQEDSFPYTIRVVSEVLSSAGSTSMASVCGSSLALMDAGVPIKSPVAGIAVGSFSKNGKRILLTDIAYAEDNKGEMDFKVGGTEAGVTAIQMDLKISGIDRQTLAAALEKAKIGRLEILKLMNKVLSKSRQALSPHAPKIKVLHIPSEKIGEVIGSGGRIIRQIMAQTGTAVEVEDDGTVSISGPDEKACSQASFLIEAITRKINVGEVFEGTVKRTLPFGAMVEFLPGKEGLVHISQLAPFRVSAVSDVVKIGQKVKVKVTEVDQVGRVNLSMRFEETRQPSENFGKREKF